MSKASYSYRVNGNSLSLVCSRSIGHGFFRPGWHRQYRAGGHGEAIPLPCLLRGHGDVAEMLFSFKEDGSPFTLSAPGKEGVISCLEGRWQLL